MALGRRGGVNVPIYEFYCPDCHTIFNFFSKAVNTTKRPGCPGCRRRKLQRLVSSFAMTGRAREADDGGDLPMDEAKMERAINALAGEAERLNEDDPRQAAQLMRKFSKMTGLQYGEGMQTALDRMEAGEDPEAIEEEMNELMGEEDPFVLQGKGKAGAGGSRKGAPARDSTLYEM